MSNSRSQPKQLLFICHDGSIYGSQMSMILMVRNVDRDRVLPLVSVAKSGPVIDLLEGESKVQVLRHSRLQWVKHDKRNLLQRMGDVLSLIVGFPFRVGALAKQIKTASDHGPIDLIHTNSVVSLEGALAAKLCGIPHVWHVREFFMRDNPKLFMVFGKHFSRWLITQFSDVIICNSKAILSQFPNAEQNPYKYRLIYNAVDYDLTPDASKQALRHTDADVLNLLYVGRLSEGKRLHDLLEAIIVLGDQAQTLHLHVAGSFVDASYEARINTLLERPELQNKVLMLGYQEDLTSLYQQADALVMPSLNEPFGRVLIEAMTHDVLCLGADSGGIPEIIEHGKTGYLFKPCEPEAIASALRLVIEAHQQKNDRSAAASVSCEQLQQIRDNARRMVQSRFTIEKQMALVQAVYDDLLVQD